MEELKLREEDRGNEKLEITQSYIKSPVSHVRLYHTTVAPKARLLEDKKGLKCSVLIFHGFTEDSSSYMEMAQHIALAGTCECHLIDFHGFGFSTGVRGYVDLVEIQNDILALVGEVIKRNAARKLALPAFVIASSYAANAVAGLLINNPDIPLAGVIMCSPAFSAHCQYAQLSILEKIFHLYVYPVVQVRMMR
ncbi:MAG: alpha/beta hydrolase [Candidatus Pacebacteria bacterium]|nr:alpha/beta hydrolase [Candidatus Paceibacterota bacterium]